MKAVGAVATKVTVGLTPTDDILNQVIGGVLLKSRAFMQSHLIGKNVVLIMTAIGIETVAIMFNIKAKERSIEWFADLNH